MNDQIARLSQLNDACLEAQALGCPHTASVLESLIQEQLAILESANKWHSLDPSTRHLIEHGVAKLPH